MSKKKKKKKRRKRPVSTANSAPPVFSWEEADGFHSLIPGTPPSQEVLDEMTRKYQEDIRNSPLWEQWVMAFGEDIAEEMLKDCRIEVRS